MKVKLAFDWNELASILVSWAVKEGAIEDAPYELDGSAITGQGEDWKLEIGLKKHKPSPTPTGEKSE